MYDRPALTPAASSRAKNRQTCRSSRQRKWNWSSTSKPQRRSAHFPDHAPRPRRRDDRVKRREFIALLDRLNHCCYIFETGVALLQPNRTPAPARAENHIAIPVLILPAPSSSWPAFSPTSDSTACAVTSSASMAVRRPPLKNTAVDHHGVNIVRLRTAHNGRHSVAERRHVEVGRRTRMRSARLPGVSGARNQIHYVFDFRLGDYLRRKLWIDQNEVGADRSGRPEHVLSGFANIRGIRSAAGAVLPPLMADERCANG
jgi:hypothetical protein